MAYFEIPSSYSAHFYSPSSWLLLRQRQLRCSYPDQNCEVPSSSSHTKQLLVLLCSVLFLQSNSCSLILCHTIYECDLVQDPLTPYWIKYLFFFFLSFYLFILKSCGILILVHRRQRQSDPVNTKRDWSNDRVLGQRGVHQDILSQKQKTKQNEQSFEIDPIGD